MKEAQSKDPIDLDIRLVESKLEKKSMELADQANSNHKEEEKKKKSQ